jgi:hypothetical protein
MRLMRDVILKYPPFAAEVPFTLGLFLIGTKISVRLSFKTALSQKCTSISLFGRPVAMFHVQLPEQLVDCLCVNCRLARSPALEHGAVAADRGSRRDCSRYTRAPAPETIGAWGCSLSRFL